MNIFVDENIPLMTVQALQDMGHDVLDIRGTEHEGTPDDIIYKIYYNKYKRYVRQKKNKYYFDVKQ